MNECFEFIRPMIFEISVLLGLTLAYLTTK